MLGLPRHGRLPTKKKKKKRGKRGAKRNRSDPSKKPKTQIKNLKKSDKTKLREGGN